jgi:CBS domain-containing protein
MEIELQEIQQFIADCMPFNLLEQDAQQNLASQFRIRYLRRNSAFPPADNDGRFLYLVRSGAIEFRDRENNLVNKLGEKDYFSDCLTIEQDQFKATAIEDTLLYQLPCKNVRALRDLSEAFDAHFSDNLSQRLKRATRLQQSAVDTGMSMMTVEVHELVKKEPVCMPADSTLQEVATAMTERGISSMMLIDNGQLVGIITDRDLRKHCVAFGVPISEPVSSIMTTNLFTIDAGSLALTAMLTMTREHVHHLPVMREGKVIGLLSATDLANHSSSNPAFLMSDIRKSNTLDELATISRRLPDLQLQLSNANVSSRHVGDLFSRLTDALTIRLIEMAEQQFGPAPVPYVWVCGGSQARREQTSHSDQDNALIIADDLNSDQQDWFRSLAKFVTDGLNSCGFVYCPGDAMASNDKWRQPLATWQKYFTDWIDKPEPMALMLSSIFFDLRPVHGDFSLFEKLQAKMLEKSKKSGIFLAHMASNALTHRPPLGFFRRFVLIHDGEHNDSFDIKHRGIVPIADIARLLALAEGSSATNTVERLRAVAGTPSISREMAENLEDAYAFISELRICHQARQIRKGISADNFLPPGKLSELDRKHLKDAFSIIQDMQTTIENRYQTGRLG